MPDLQIVAMTKRNRLSILYYSNPRYFDRFAQSFGLLQKDSLDARKSHGFISKYHSQFHKVRTARFVSLHVPPLHAVSPFLKLHA